MQLGIRDRRPGTTLFSWFTRVHNQEDDLAHRLLLLSFSAALLSILCHGLVGLGLQPVSLLSSSLLSHGFVDIQKFVGWCASALSSFKRRMAASVNHAQTVPNCRRGPKRSKFWAQNLPKIFEIAQFWPRTAQKASTLG